VRFFHTLEFACGRSSLSGGEPERAEGRDGVSVMVDRIGPRWVLYYEVKGLMFAAVYHTILGSVWRPALAVENGERVCTDAWRALGLTTARCNFRTRGL